MNTPPAGLGITMPNLHEMGGENTALILGAAERRQRTRGSDRQLLGAS